VALQDGRWHSVDSYQRERAMRADTVKLWQKVRTVEDPQWTQRYHSHDPAEKAFGGRVEIRLKNGRIISDEMAVANAHPLGARPFVRANYMHKFEALTQDVVSKAEQRRFLDVVARLKDLRASDLPELNV